MNRPTTDRGQLVLAGSIAFALILLGIAVVFTTTLYTANIGSSGTVETVADGTSTEQSVELTTDGLMTRVNQQNDWLLTQNETFVDRTEPSSRSKLEENLAENVSEYDALLAESKSETAPTYVNVTPASYSYGTRVKQTSFVRLPSEQLVNGEPFDEFVLLIDVGSSISGDRMVVQVTGAGGNDAYVGIEKSSGQVRIDSGSTDAGLLASAECTVSPDDGTVYVDLTGEFAAGDPFDPADHQHCPQRFTEELESPYQLQVTEIGGLDYQYEYTVGVDRSTYSRPTGVTANFYDVIWMTETEVVYETRTVERESSVEVSSYEP